MVEGLSILDKKRNQKDGKNDKESESDWIGFLKSIVSALLITFIWGIFGSNFLYLQKYVTDKQTDLGNLFPVDDKQPPYSDGRKRTFRDNLKEGLTKGMGDMKARLAAMKSARRAKTDLTQKGGAVSEKRLQMFDKLAGLSTYSSPYNWKDSQQGLVGDFKAWLAESIEFSYINGRSFFHKMFDVSSSLGSGTSPALVILLSVPIVALLLQIVPFYGFLSTLVGMFQAPNKGWIWALVFLFVLGIDFFVAGGVAVWQTVQTFFTFIVLPLMLDMGGVMNIMSDHSYFLTAMFGLIVVANAFSFLNVMPSVIMLLTYVFLLWKHRT
jgi:hypothetical protein